MHATTVATNACDNCHYKCMRQLSLQMHATTVTTNACDNCHSEGRVKAHLTSHKVLVASDNPVFIYGSYVQPAAQFKFLLW